MNTITIEQFKNDVKKMKVILNDLDIPIQHSQMLEAFSKFYNYRNWQTAKSCIEKQQTIFNNTNESSVFHDFFFSSDYRHWTIEHVNHQYSYSVVCVLVDDFFLDYENDGDYSVIEIENKNNSFFFSSSDVINAKKITPNSWNVNVYIFSYID